MDQFGAANESSYSNFDSKETARINLVRLVNIKGLNLSLTILHLLMLQWASSNIKNMIFNLTYTIIKRNNEYLSLDSAVLFHFHTLVCILAAKVSGALTN